MLESDGTNHDGTCGVVIVGPSGSGRRSAFDEAYARLSGTPRLVKLNGSSFGSSVPRGVLSFLLAQLKPGESETRHSLVHGLAKLLCPDGKPSVVLLGRPDLIDEESASLIAQLASMRHIKLVVHCTQTRDLPRDLLSLHRSGQLGQVSVRRMTAIDARIFLADALGAEVSVFAAATLHCLAGSNRALMLQLARTWMADGQLVQHNGVWVLLSAQVTGGPAFSALLNGMISGLNGAEREFLAALALGGPVALEAVHKAGLVREMDGLFAAGHVRRDSRGAGQVAIGLPLLTQLLRYELQEESLEDARRLLRRLHRDPGAVCALANARAFTDVGEFESVVAEGARFALHGYLPAGWRRDPKSRTRLLNLQVKALTLLGRHGEAYALIEDAGQGLQEALRLGDDERLERVAQELKLQLARLSPGATQYAREPQAEHFTTGPASWKTESLHLRAAVIQAIRWAEGTRHADALAAIGQIGRELQIMNFNGHLVDTFSYEEAAELEALLLHGELLAGGWKTAMARAEELARGKYANPRVIALAEAVRGILLCLAGETERALGILQPCLEQLSHGTAAFERAAVESATTYALMSLGRHAEGTELLSRGLGTARPKGSLGFFAWSAEVFASLAVARMDSPTLALARLEAFAELAADAGFKSLEMHTAAFALRLGNAQAALRLEEASSVCQGEMAGGLLGLARAVRVADSASSCAALIRLAQAGAVLLGIAGDNTIVENLTAREQRQLSRFVAGLRQRGTGPEKIVEQTASSAAEPAPRWTHELTKRESQVALLAIEGCSNQEIARANGVSIRTVEGHLYQVYSKLQVRNRQELTALDRTSRRTAGHR